MKFRNKFVFILFLKIFLSFDLAISIDFDEGCFLDEDSPGGGGNGSSGKSTMLKLAFVVDQTHSFQLERTAFLPFITPLALAIKTFYRKSEYALTTFADWPVSAGPDVGPELVVPIPSVISSTIPPFPIKPIKTTKPSITSEPPHDDAEACYGRQQTFTADYIQIPSTLRQVVSLPNGGKENSLAAMVMTILDKGILWEANTNNEKTRKVVMVLTDRIYGNISKPGNRHDFKGDGSDTCSTSKPPTLAQVGEILAKHKVAVIALIAPSQQAENALEWYRDHIGSLPTVPFCGKEFDIKENLRPDKIVEFVKGCLFGFEEAGGGGGGGGGGSGGGGQKGDPCIFGDPVGFNTLGL